jgi:hypothetical protein
MSLYILMGAGMRIFLLLLVAIISLTSHANALSIVSQTECSCDPPFWADIYVGYAGVTSDVTVGTPKNAAFQQSFPYGTFFSETIFSTGAGPIKNGTFNGFLGSSQSAGTSISGITVTSIFVGPRADSPPQQTIGIGDTVFSLTAEYATLNPTPGSISVFEQGAIPGIGLASFSLTQTGSNLDGSLILSDGSATRTVQFDASGLQGVYLSPAVSAVPLPPALPMFAFALIALGLFAFIRSRPTSRARLQNQLVDL